MQKTAATADLLVRRSESENSDRPPDLSHVTICGSPATPEHRTAELALAPSGDDVVTLPHTVGECFVPMLAKRFGRVSGAAAGSVHDYRAQSLRNRGRSDPLSSCLTTKFCASESNGPRWRRETPSSTCGNVVRPEWVSNQSRSRKGLKCSTSCYRSWHHV